MKIMRYDQIKELPLTSRAKQDTKFRRNELNWQQWHGETIAIIGSRESGRALLLRLVEETRNEYNLSTFLPEKIKILLAPFNTIAETIFLAVKTFKEDLKSKADIHAAAEKYITAAGLQPFRDKYPLDTPDLVCRQARLALNFIVSGDMMILDNLFQDLGTFDKAQLHTAMLNLNYSEPRLKTIIFTTQEAEDAIFMSDRILVVSPNNLGEIAESIKIWFARPRDRRTLSSLPAYKSVKKRLHYLLTDVLAIQDIISLRQFQLLP